MKWGFIALVATLAFILAFMGGTDVVTLFVGSHHIIDISSSSGTGNDIDCTWCHQQIRNELDNAIYHSWMVCEDCHRYDKEGTGIVFAESGTAGEEAHAAYTPRCLDCHDKAAITLANGTAVPIKKADAFGDADYGSDYSAHKKFVEDSLNFSLSVGENEACIACHTNYSVDIEYSYFWNINYALSGWSFTSFSYNGTRYNTSSKSESGAKHEFIATTDIDCTSCHYNIYDALVTGTPDVADEDYLTHAPIEIDAARWNEDNPWGHFRYHYIPEEYRATGVNNSYCFECHNVKKYVDKNPSDNTTYSLGDVTADTNSTQVHAAEALWCQTCHGSGKTKGVIDNLDYPKGGQDMEGHSIDGSNGGFVDDVADNYARTFHGDICMGCHEAALHPTGGCSSCHKMGNVDVYIESEPSGYGYN